MCGTAGRRSAILRIHRGQTRRVLSSCDDRGSALGTRWQRADGEVVGSGYCNAGGPLWGRGGDVCDAKPSGSIGYRPLQTAIERRYRLVRANQV